MQNSMLLNEITGYYTCNGVKYSSKIKACIQGTILKKPVQWHFNDEIFDRYPWNLEPTLSLDQLYDKRARELREKYDYIILSYSGGSDSNNILEAFLRQGLFIDEIVTNVMHDRNSITILDKSCVDSWNESAEYYFQTMPRLKHVENVSPKTKITVVDISNHVFQFFDRIGDENWLEYTRERLNVTGLLRNNFLHFKEIRNTFDKGKKIAVVLGIEKPRTYVKDGMFKLMFVDKAMNISTVEEFFTDYENTGVEYFYSHPDCADMICKQAHTIKHFLEKNPEWLYRWSPRSFSHFNKMHRLIHERALRNIIYTTWHDDVYWQANKSTLDWYNQFDTWFYKDYRNTKEYRIWEAGLKHVKENAKDYIKGYFGGVDSDNYDLGLVPFIKIYDIGQVSNKTMRMGNRHFPKWADL